ncbi:hypothetical protein NL676_031253 [Syzygium grande]|nr:hypothetical protein NL676_031253 [Syzygium grande]
MRVKWLSFCKQLKRPQSKDRLDSMTGTIFKFRTEFKDEMPAAFGTAVTIRVDTSLNALPIFRFFFQPMLSITVDGRQMLEPPS